MVKTINKENIYEILEEIKDPEIPVLSVREMGILRDVSINDDIITVVITPTYTGCPALFQIKDDIQKKLQSEGIENFVIKTSIFPPWTTDWMSDESKEKLENFGIAPPSEKKQVVCPYCKSDKTILKSLFSSTACKSLHYCNNCSQPFEQFKCH